MAVFRISEGGDHFANLAHDMDEAGLREKPLERKHVEAMAGGPVDPPTRSGHIVTPRCGGKVRSRVQSKAIVVRAIPSRIDRIEHELVDLYAEKGSELLKLHFCGSQERHFGAPHTVVEGLLEADRESFEPRHFGNCDEPRVLIQA